MSEVMADNAPGGRAQKNVVMGVVARDAADQRALYATFGVSGSGSDRHGEG